MVDMTTWGCHDVCMTTSLSHEESFRRIKEARAQAIEHTKIARRFSAERRELMLALIDEGVSQADIARELGVTRQAVQKMLAC
jgi:DNA invertase Pin-like site-specific DNA recombinase